MPMLITAIHYRQKQGFLVVQWFRIHLPMQGSIPALGGCHMLQGS